MTLLLVGRNEARLNAVADSCRQKGATVVPFICDIRDREKMEAFILGEDDKAPVVILYIGLICRLIWFLLLRVL